MLVLLGVLVPHARSHGIFNPEVTNKVNLAFMVHTWSCIIHDAVSSIGNGYVSDITVNRL